MATLKEAIQTAKQDPNNPKSQQLLKYLSDGKFDAQAATEGIDLTKFKTNLQSKSNPMQQSSTDQRSVAERMGWLGEAKSAIGNIAKNYANEIQTQPKPQFNPLKTETPSSGAQAMVNRAKNQEEDDGPGFFGRIKDTVVKTGEAIWEGAGDAQEGNELMKAAKDREGIAQTYALKWKKAYKEGRIDEATYKQKMASADKILQDSRATNNEGFSKQVAGGARVFGSAAEGVITGGFGPETEKVMNFAAEKIGDSQKATEFVASLSKLAEEHPAMANYLTAFAEVAGVTKGTKVLKNVGEGAIDATKRAVPVITDTVRRAGDAPMVTNAIQKLQDIGTTAGQKFEKKFGPDMVPEEFVDPKAVAKIQKMVTPDINKKEMQQALLDQRVVRGKEGFWSGRAPDEIDVARNVKKGTETIAKNIPGASGLNDVKLHAKLGETIKTLSEKLKPQFKAVQLKPEIISKAKEAWAKAKNMQIEDPILASFPGLKTAQKNFENVLESLSKRVRTKDGKFRMKDLNDLWELRKNYDRTVKDSIKELVAMKNDSASLYQKVWMQNREILNDFLKTEAERMGVNVKKMFGEMNDYYTVQNEIFRLIKGNKGKDGAFKAAAKEVLKASAIPGVSIAGAYAISK